MLGNPTYTGKKIRWRNQLFDGIHDPLIDDVMFELAQAILHERGADISRRRGNASDFLLSGVLRCGRCGKAYIGMSARGKGGLYHYYACTGRQKYGPTACDNQRLPREKLETGRHPPAHQPLPQPPTSSKQHSPTPNTRSRTTPARDQTTARRDRRRDHPERAGNRALLPSLRGRQTRPRTLPSNASPGYKPAWTNSTPNTPNSTSQPAHQATHGPTAGEFAAVADQLETLLTTGEPQKVKALIRELVTELRVNSKTDVQPTYRIITPDRTHTAGVCATSEKVGRAGIEPATLGLRGR